MLFREPALLFFRPVWKKSPEGVARTLQACPLAAALTYQAFSIHQRQLMLLPSKYLAYKAAGESGAELSAFSYESLEA